MLDLTGVEKLGQRRCCPFLFNQLGDFLVDGKFTENASSDSLKVQGFKIEEVQIRLSDVATYLNVFDVVVEEQLHKDWNDILLSDQLTVVVILRQNVKSAHSDFDDLLHANAVSVSSRLLRTGSCD